MEIKMFKKFGLIGSVLGHSLSPQLHELVYKYTEIKGDYTLWPMEENKLDAFFDNLRKNNISGINVTIPYKTNVLKYVDSISKEAKSIGAVNTITITPDAMHGYNTDYFGVEKMLSYADIDINNKKVMVLGAGGSARTVVTYLQDNNASDILIVHRNPEKAKKEFKLNICNYNDIKKHDYDVLINTTPVGMYPKIDACPLPEVLMTFESVVDLIYNPMQTKLLRIAKLKGCKTVNGLYMLIAQGVKSQEIWNNTTIDDSIITKIYDEIKELL